MLSRDFRFRKNVEKAWAHLEGEEFGDDAGVALLIAEALNSPVEIPALEKVQAALQTRLEAYFSASADATRWEVSVGQVLVNQRGTPAFEAGAKALAALEVEGSNARRWVTGAAFQVGGETWTAWNQRMQTHVLPSQVRDDGPASGSWPAEEGRSALDVTLDHVFGLEAYYRYERKK